MTQLHTPITRVLHIVLKASNFQQLGYFQNSILTLKLQTPRILTEKILFFCLYPESGIQTAIQPHVIAEFSLDSLRLPHFGAVKKPQRTYSGQTTNR